MDYLRMRVEAARDGLYADPSRDNEAALLKAAREYASHMATCDRSALLGHAELLRRDSESDDPFRSHVGGVELRAIEPHLEIRGSGEDLVLV